jgi:hypothetical protein
MTLGAGISTGCVRVYPRGEDEQEVSDVEGPSDALREHIATRAEETESEEELDDVLSEIEDAMSTDFATVESDDPIDDLAAIDAWAGLASYAVARFYAPSSPWPRRLGGWGKRAARRLRRIVSALEPRLKTAAQKTGASSWSIGVSFPWGIQVSLTWP